MFQFISASYIFILTSDQELEDMYIQLVYICWLDVSWCKFSVSLENGCSCHPSKAFSRLILFHKL